MTVTGDQSAQPSPLRADDRAKLAMYLGRTSERVRRGAIAPAWTPDGAGVAYVDASSDTPVAWRICLTTGRKTHLVDVGEARAAIASALAQTLPTRGLPFTEFVFSDHDEIEFEVDHVKLRLNLRTAIATTADAPEGVGGTGWTPSQPRDALRSPDGEWSLFTAEHRLFARSRHDDRTVLMADRSSSDDEWRLNPLRACWAPDSARAVASRVDLRHVYRAPQLRYTSAHADVAYTPLARAGGALERTTLHAFSLSDQSSTEIELGDTTDTYVIPVVWRPNSSELVIFQMTRDCKNTTVLVADVLSGKVNRLFDEKAESFVRTVHDVHFDSRVGLWLAPDGESLIWSSERSGWRHLYLYDLEGNLVRALTSGEWRVEDFITIADTYMYFTGHGDTSRPYDLHLYRVPLAGGEVEPLTEAPGVHDVSVAPSGRAFLDCYSSPVQPPIVELRNVERRSLAVLTRADTSQLERTGHTPPEQFIARAADAETELWGVLFKPDDFDPSSQYPLIEWIYGGPQVAVVPHRFVQGGGSYEERIAHAAQELAQLGVLTMMVDGRGTPGRSKAFHDASYRNFANVLADDHAGAICQIAARFSYIDRARVGVIGHSWGGYSAFRCLAERPDVYHAAVCLAPGFEHSLFVSECYLDLPAANPIGYTEASAYPLAAQIDAPVMLIAGTSDAATWTDAVRMSEALIHAGKNHEFVPLPDQHHFSDAVHETYLWRKVADFFGRHLKISCDRKVS